MANKRKRANGDADVYPHRNGRGEIFGYRGPYWVQTDRGPECRTVSGKTKTETRAKLTRAEAEAGGGVAFDAGKQTLGDYLERWLSDSAKSTLKPTATSGRCASTSPPPSALLSWTGCPRRTCRRSTAGS